MATDHVIESFRNDLWPGYKTGAGIDPDLWSQAWPLEEALAALGVLVWPMVDLEADDALASGGRGGRRRCRRRPGPHLHARQGPRAMCPRRPRRAAGPAEARVDRRGRRRCKVRCGPGVHPGYLALVGDSADGFPGLAGWGAKSAAAVLARWGHLEDIPPDPAAWEVAVRGAPKLAGVLAASRDEASCSRIWRLSGWTAPSSAGSRTCAGRAPRSTSPESAPTSTEPACCDGQRHWRPSADRSE